MCNAVMSSIHRRDQAVARDRRLRNAHAKRIDTHWAIAAVTGPCAAFRSDRLAVGRWMISTCTSGTSLSEDRIRCPGVAGDGWRQSERALQHQLVAWIAPPSI